MFGQVVDDEVVDGGEGGDADGADEVDDGPGELAGEVDCGGISDPLFFLCLRDEKKHGWNEILQVGSLGGW